MRKNIKHFSIFLAAILVALSMFVFVSCNKDDSSSSSTGEFSLAQGTHPNLENRISSSSQEIIDKGLLSSATEQEKKDAIIELYNVANQSRIDTALSLELQNSNAGISLGDVIMHGFALRNGDKFYYQMATSVYSEIEILQLAMTEFAGLLKVGYSTGDGNYYYSQITGSQTECDCSITTFPYATFKLTSGFDTFTKETYTKELNCLTDFFEINNMDYCAEIIKDGATISLQDGYYKVHFEIDCENGDETLLKKWFAKSNEDMKVGGNEIECYNSYEMDLEVWDNGYVKYTLTHEDRTCSGMASGKPVNEFTFLWNEDEILAVLAEDAATKEGYSDLEYKSIFNNVDSYLSFYSIHEVEKAGLSDFIIGVIVVCSILGAVIIALIIAKVVIEIGLKKGKYPKIAAKRQAKKEKKLAKKNKKNGETISDSTNESNK